MPFVIEKVLALRSYQSYKNVGSVAVNKKSVIAGISAVGEICAALNKFPWENILLTIGMGTLCALVLFICLLKMVPPTDGTTSGIFRLVTCVTGLLFLIGLSIFALLLFSNVPDPAGSVIQKSSLQTIAEPTTQKVEKQIVIPMAVDADALRATFSAPNDESRLQSLYAAPANLQEFDAVDVQMAGSKTDAILYSSPRKDKAAKAKIVMTLQSDTDTSPIKVFVQLEYLRRSTLWEILRWIYTYYQKA